MSWFGKLLGGVIGFSFGGPIGAILGGVVGHQIDKKGEDLEPGSQERVQAAFFTATFSVMGHIAKADGRVTDVEIRHAEEVMRRMGLDQTARKLAVDLFNQGKNQDFDLDGVLEQFKRECHRRRNLMQMFMEVQISMAMADGIVHERERAVLHDVGKSLGFPVFMIDQLIKMVQAQQRFYQHSQQQGGEHGGPGYQAASGPSVEQAYQVLGVKASDDQQTVKRAYRRLMSQHHPDKLVAKGLPEQMIKMATEKTQEIKAAYELVKRHKSW
ncbi:co-chaperone DjlA [Kangiella koreensis]|uniref:Co-chaperone protein DjlA n=1 Tax=Kangiella koreensis (strain DSM 16069 / JCM 12317 / KCTC 12182 / SW-125) TaxID=523791 RepID=C7R7T5_KANKD|nr:co-chaperone DjlA [Kangiella koreensis]ACV27618.1 heat shock protein DnaJ domain protein [Kangiella koreensis DSM 16069]